MFTFSELASSPGRILARTLAHVSAGIGILTLLFACSPPGDRGIAPPRSSLAATETPATVAEAPAPRPIDGRRVVRGTGKLRAVNEDVILAPRLQGRNNRFTLTHLIANGSRVAKGDPLAEFDRTEQAEQARTAAAQLDDLTHQISQRQAENRANAAKRSAEMREAQADLEKANIQLRIAEIRSDIDRDKNRVKAETAARRVEMLKEIHHLRSESDAADLRILELQRDRQQVALNRATRNAELLVIKAPLDGMVALEAIWRNNSRGPAQVGDQIFRGSPLLRIFDPTQMDLTVELGEPDGAALVPGAEAEVVLDAYPQLVFHASLVSASPVAASALGSPIRRFMATFLIRETDPHLLPDLTAQVIIQVASSPADTEVGQ